MMKKQNIHKDDVDGLQVFFVQRIYTRWKYILMLLGVYTGEGIRELIIDLMYRLFMANMGRECHDPVPH